MYHCLYYDMKRLLGKCRYLVMRMLQKVKTASDLEVLGFGGKFDGVFLRTLRNSSLASAYTRNQLRPIKASNKSKLVDPLGAVNVYSRYLPTDLVRTQREYA